MRLRRGNAIIFHLKDSRGDFSVKSYLFPRVNREGRRFGLVAFTLAFLYLAGTVAVGVVCPAAGAAMGLFVLPLFLVAWGVVLFFRDPERFPPDDPKAVLSPADGRVCMVERCELPQELGGGGSRWRVSVFMSVMDVHVNRMPAAAQVMRLVHVPGRFLNAALDKASSENERCCYLMRTDEGTEYGVVQIAGLVARRIVPFVKEGDRLGTAERFGLIRFGSRLDVYLPEGVEPEVRPGQTMRSGETVIGHMK